MCTALPTRGTNRASVSRVFIRSSSQGMADWLPMWLTPVFRSTDTGRLQSKRREVKIWGGVDKRDAGWMVKSGLYLGYKDLLKSTVAVLYKWNDAICNILRVFFFFLTQHNSLGIHSICLLFVPCYCCVVLCGRQFLSHQGWSSGVFPVFSYYAMNICVHIFVWIWVFISQECDYCLYGSCRFSFIRNCQIVFQSTWTISHPHQPYMSDSVSLYPHQHLALTLLFILAMLIGV